MIPQAHKIITEITIGYLTMPFPVLDLWTSNRGNLCFDFAVLQEHLGPVFKRLMADLLEIEQILHHVRNLLFTVYLETTLLKGKSIHAF